MNNFTIAALALASLASWATAQTESPKIPARGATWETRVPPNPTPPPLALEPASFYFGDLKPNEKRSTEVRITNTSDAVLTITDVRSTCWCATNELSEKVLAPGASVTMTATLDAGPDPVSLDRAIWISAEGYSLPREFRLLANVNYGIRWHIEYIPEDQTSEGAIHLESVNGRPFSVISANFTQPQYLDGFDPESDAPRATYLIRYSLGFPGVAAQSDWLIIETDHPESPVIDLPVILEEEAPRTLRPWIAAERRVMLGQLRQGQAIERTVLLRGLSENPLTMLTDIKLEPDVLEVTPLGMEASAEGLRVRLRIKPRADTHGLIYAALTFTARDHTERIQLMGRALDK